MEAKHFLSCTFMEWFLRMPPKFLENWKSNFFHSKVTFLFFDDDVFRKSDWFEIELRPTSQTRPDFRSDEQIPKQIFNESNLWVTTWDKSTNTYNSNKYVTVDFWTGSYEKKIIDGALKLKNILRLSKRARVWSQCAETNTSYCCNEMLWTIFEQFWTIFEGTLVVQVLQRGAISSRGQHWSRIKS